MKKPVPENMHELYNNIFLKYISIGGFPKVVKEYINTHIIASTYRILNNIVFDMKIYFGRRKDKNNKATFKPGEVSRFITKI